MRENDITTKAINIIFLLAVVGTARAAGRDAKVNNVRFSGDSTLMAMTIKAVYATDGAFLVQTTGARYEYAPSELKIYQGFDPNQRLLATITFDKMDRFEKVESNKDHALFWSERFNVGIYGDSTCIIAPKAELEMNCKGYFKPDYEGRYKGELLLIDNLGGMEIYPQRYEGGYDINTMQLGKKDWVANYRLKANERVMLAAFPGKPFDLEKSFSCNAAYTYGNNKKGVGTPYGEMPSDWTITRWSKNFNIIIVWYGGLYINPEPAGPYFVANKTEFERFLKTVHEHGMKAIVYCSLVYHYNKLHSVESFFEQIKDLRGEYNIDGVYVDGLTSDYLTKMDNKIVNWEMIRRLRKLFGSSGVIFLHGTNLGSPVATVPNVDTYCDITLNGEGVAFKSVNDSYVRYQVRKYGISNTVAMWKRGPHPASITDKQIIDAILAMNGRECYWTARDINLSAQYKYYLKRLEELKESYSKNITVSK